MFVTRFNDDDVTSEGDLIFRERPNMILYWIEATRVIILGLLCMDVGLVTLLHIAKGAPIIFLIELTVLLNFILFSIFVVVLMLATLKMEFLITLGNVVVRYSPFGVGRRSLSIPVTDVAAIELRRYGSRYGSVYLKRSSEAAGQGSSVPVTKVSDASAWTSLPWSWPPMVGFYGFEKYREFAEAIVRLRAEARDG